MKQVIRIDEESKEKKQLTPIEFTAILSPERGWRKDKCTPDTYDRVVYLGCDLIHGDCFVAYYGDSIHMFKGYINDGVY